MSKKEKYVIDDDIYGTRLMSFQGRFDFYQKKYFDMKETKLLHVGEIQNLRNMKRSTENVMDFKKEEINKKMKNEIFRLKEESKRHEESQANENKKIAEGCEGVQDLANANEDLLEEILERVIYLEKNLGPDLRNEKIVKRK
jgi:hypothetical protein